MTKPTILIVDDDKEFADKFAEFLNDNFNCNVIVRNSSNGSVYVLKDEKVDVLFLDIHNTGPSGFEVVKRMKELEIKDVETFLMTSWKEEAYYAKSADLGVHFLPKPIKYKLLQNTLTDMFNKKEFSFKKK